MRNFGYVKTTISPKLIAKIKNINQTAITLGFTDKLGTMLVREVKASISRGFSPVAGVGRFAAYKDPDKYPGDRKPSRPVNLSLTGDMLSYLNYRRVAGKIQFGIFEDEVSSELMARVDTHNRGTHPHVPRRQFIPLRGQGLIASIQSKVRKMFRERLAEVVARFK